MLTDSAAVPTMSPAAGTGVTSVTLSSVHTETTGFEIRYSTSGSATCASTSYTAFAVLEGKTVKAVACGTNFITSPELSQALAVTGNTSNFALLI